MTSPVLAVLWFDTEDFVNPETDDAPLRIANLMEKNGVRVVFKIVGEKLRALKDHKRTDVLEAMSRHDIGYHSNTHSIHPIICEYVGDSTWDEGEKEFEENERAGFEEIKGSFGRELSCYGHPGTSWVPQAYPVLKRWNIPVYLDETSTISPLNERPFWYGNVLNLMCLGSNVLTLDAGVSLRNLPDDWLDKVPGEFKRIYEKLRSEDQVGLISVFCHPTTYVTSEWWERKNFLDGKNPPGMKPAKASLKIKSRSEEDLRNLDSFVKMVKELPDIHFVAASDALEIYKDKADSHHFTIDELRTLCEKSVDEVNYLQVSQEIWVSAAEIYGMVLIALNEFREKGVLPQSLSCPHPLGPTSFPKANFQIASWDLGTFLDACRKEIDRTIDSGYISGTINVGAVNLSPVDFFATCCWTFVEIANDRIPRRVEAKQGNFEVAKMVTDEGAKKDWSYPHYAKGFSAPKQTELARLQTWTLKPATADVSKIRWE
ncbi:MAG: hypothetical protein OK439_03355 [Thaumarchaeota archaeon]|nr:hypothetical protein [Nitrososphaerota archaeon]